MEGPIPRDGSGIYSTPSGTAAVSGATIASSPYNTFLSDLVSDLNAARPIVAGGTGATSASAALSNLGGQPLDADLTALAALGYTSGQYIIKKTAANTYSLVTLDTAVETWLTTPSSANLAAAVTGETGSGALVFATSPTLVTPTLGVASATSINKVALTAPATGSTLTIADGKTLTASNTLTLAGTDGSTLNVGTGGTLGTAALKNTGTSGNTVPLLDGANAWSAAQDLVNNIALNIRESGGTARSAVKMNGSNVMEFGNANNNATFLNAANTFNGDVGVTGSLTKGGVAVPTISSSDTLSNKTISSPTLSGTVAGTPGWASRQTIPGVTLTSSLTFSGSHTPAALSIFNDGGQKITSSGGTGGHQWNDNANTVALMTLSNAGVLALQGNTVLTTATGAQLGAVNAFTAAGQHSFDCFSTTNRSSSANILLNRANQNQMAGFRVDAGAANDVVWGVFGGTDEFFVGFDNGSAMSTPVRVSTSGLQARVATSSETGGTLTSASANKQVDLASDPTINDGVFTAKDRIEFYAGASARSIVQDTGMTLRLDGTSTTGNRTLAARGRASVYFVSDSEAIVSGMGVT